MAKEITITRKVEGPCVDWLVFYKGEFIGCGVTEQDTPSYDAAQELARRFLSDLETASVPERYLAI